MCRNVANAIQPVNSHSDISSRYTGGMDRVSELKKIIDSRFGGSQAEFARAIGRSPSSVWQWLSGHRNVGEKAARDIERRLRIIPGTLDGFVSEVREAVAPYNRGQELEFAGHLDTWDSETPLDDDEVEVPLFREVELAAGTGQTQVVENHGPKLRFAKSTLARAGVQPEHAACAYVRGNSMEPVMPDGTCVGVNTGDKDIRDGEIYAFDHDGMLRVKYLHRRPGGGIRIVSQNSTEHSDEELTGAEVSDQIRLIGRVFWWSVLR